MLCILSTPVHWSLVLLFMSQESQQGQKGVFFYSPHVAGLTCLAFPPSPGASNVLYTSSYDGSIKCMDVERELFDEVGDPETVNISNT